MGGIPAPDFLVRRRVPRLRLLQMADVPQRRAHVRNALAHSTPAPLRNSLALALATRLGLVAEVAVVAALAPREPHVALVLAIVLLVKEPPLTAAGNLSGRPTPRSHGRFI